uniref:Uncharacterized protein n=1 Tax=Sphaerodactylus townsendi TaxID=933632 RepID=A0ACB8ETE3_9SAUR
MEDDLEQQPDEVPIDVYSSQFESILDSASLSDSAASEESLYSEPEISFSFEMPLTPMIQQRIKEDTQFLERPGNREVEMGHCDGIANGLEDMKESDIMEACPLDRAKVANVQLKSAAARPGKAKHTHLGPLTS